SMTGPAAGDDPPACRLSDELRRGSPHPGRARSGYSAAMPNALDDWFVREILVHERALAQYLRRCRVDRDEQHDLRQEVYARVYEAAADTPPANPEAFLFTTARNLIADRVRRSRVVSIEPMGDFDASFV